MKTELKKSLSNKKTPLILSILSIISGAICVLVGEIALPFAVAFLAALFVFDFKGGRSISFVTSVLLVLINLIGPFLGISPSAFSLSAIVLALFLSYGFTKDQSKSDTAYVMTVVCAFFSLVGYILFAMYQMGEYSMEAVTEFYGKLTHMLRESFVVIMSESYKTAGMEISVDVIRNIFNSQISMIISYLLIGGFIIVGFSMKLFGVIVGKLAEDTSEIKSWRFKPTSLFAYFYIILAIASIFTSSLDNVFAVSVANLYSVFMVIFAYVGFNFTLENLVKKMKPVTVFIVLAVCVLLFASFALQLLAVIGVMFIIRTNNEGKISEN